METKASKVLAPGEPAVLVVCADPALQRMYGETLGRACQAQIIQATDGQQALDAAARHAFACALIDVQLPESDCVELAELIRVQQHPELTPLMFIVGEDPDPSFLKRCYLIGAADVVMQRPNPQVLVQKVRVYVELFRRQQQLKTEVQLVRGKNRNLIRENREFLRMQGLLRRRATHDSLTGLPNRPLFADRLTVAVARTRREGKPLAVMFFDLDHFKAVNDDHGHSAGDTVLRTVSRRLTQALRASDTVARLGGDEFGVILEGLGREAVAQVADKVRMAINKPMSVESTFLESQTRVAVDASIGVAMIQEDETDLQELINRADQMMLLAKRAGGGVRIDVADRRLRTGDRVKPFRERRGTGDAPADDLESTDPQENGHPTRRPAS